MTNEDVILPDDPRAARLGFLVAHDPGAFKTTVVLVSRNGTIFQNEHDARRSSATHLRCDCGEIYPKHSFCQPCANKRAEDRYMALPGRDWRDGAMICDGDETFIDTFDEMADLVFQNPNATGRHWVFAGPKDHNHRFIDICDLIADYGHEDFDFSDEAYAAADALEEILRKEFAAVLWPSDTRVTFGTFNAWLAEQEKADAKL